MRRTLALVLALAAVLLFAPIARADIDGGIAPYRDLVDSAVDGSPIVPTDDDDDGDDDEDEQEESDDDEDDEDDEDEADEEDDEDDVEVCHVPPGNPDATHTVTVGAPAVPAHMEHDGGETLGSCDDDGSDDGDNDNPGTGPDTGTPPEQPTGPSTSAVAAFPAFWLWLLVIALAGGAAAAALLFRRRRMRSR